MVSCTALFTHKKQQSIQQTTQLCRCASGYGRGTNILPNSKTGEMLTCPRPCSRIAFWKIVSLSPVSIMLSTSASVGFLPVTMCARRSTTSLQAHDVSSKNTSNAFWFKSALSGNSSNLCFWVSSDNGQSSQNVPNVWTVLTVKMSVQPEPKHCMQDG